MLNWSSMACLSSLDFAFIQWSLVWNKVIWTTLNHALLEYQLFLTLCKTPKILFPIMGKKIPILSRYFVLYYNLNIQGWHSSLGLPTVFAKTIVIPVYFSYILISIQRNTVIKVGWIYFILQNYEAQWKITYCSNMHIS